MGRKPVEFSGHCEARLAEYGITRRTVRRLLAEGERVGTLPGGFNVVGGTARFRLAGRVRKRKAVVGCYEDAERIMVRSVIPILTPHELKELHEYRKKRRVR